jgi:4-oxalocrotonate tautomerase
LIKFILLLAIINIVPIVTIAVYSGKTQTEKDRLAEAITEDVVRILKVPKKEVIILFQETAHGNWYASGVRL